MGALTLTAEQTQHLCGRAVRAAEPVRHVCVEFCDLSGSQGQVTIAEDESHLPAQHVQPFVPFVRSRVGADLITWDQDLPCLNWAWLRCEGDDDPAIYSPGL